MATLKALLFVALRIVVCAKSGFWSTLWSTIANGQHIYEGGNGEWNIYLHAWSRPIATHDELIQWRPIPARMESTPICCAGLLVAPP